VVVDGAVGDVVDSLQSLAVQRGGKEEDAVADLNGFVVAVSGDFLEGVGHGQVGVLAYWVFGGQDDRMDRIPGMVVGVAGCRGDARWAMAEAFVREARLKPAQGRIRARFVTTD